MAKIMSRRKFLTFPNALSVLAIICGGVALYLGVWQNDRQNNIENVLWISVAGAVLCLFDGFIAEYYDEFTAFGDEVLQPLAGAALAVAGIATLTVTDHWAPWVWKVLAAYFGLLQSIDILARIWPRTRWIRVAKRHQFYVHPISAIVVTVFAVVQMAIVVYADGDMRLVVGISIVVLIGLALLRWPRVEYWLDGPPSPTA